jgi:hypothetical protein
MDRAIVEWVPAIALAIALAATSGLRAWLPLLLAGLLTRSGFLELGSSFAFLASNRALAILAIASALEILGDKIPVVDHTLDTLGTPLKLASGALLAAAAFGTVSDPLTATLLGLAVGAPTALVPHAAKSLVRVASTAVTGGLANPLLSFLEDLMTLAAFALAVLVPIAVAGFVLLVVALMARRSDPRPQTAGAA